MPSRIAIAVTGHRDIRQTKFLKSAVYSVVDRIQLLFPTDDFIVYSCLAEGADQLLGRYLLEQLSAELAVILPLAEPEYLKDFRTVESISEFLFLKSLAKDIVNLPQSSPRPLAYRIANQFILSKCNFLIAIWDGKPSRGIGGTGEMVAMARQAKLPLIWIRTVVDSNTISIIEERFLVK